MSIVLLPYSLKYCSHIVIYFFLNIQLSCIVCNFGERRDHHRNHKRSHNTTANENNPIIVHIPPGILHFAEKYIHPPNTIASVGNNIPIGVAISRIIIIIIANNHHPSPTEDIWLIYCPASSGTTDCCSWVCWVLVDFVFCFVIGIYTYIYK